MKLRHSLRLYVIGIMLVAGVTLTFVLSGLGVRYFITGLDIGIKRTLIMEAQHAEASDGQPFRQLSEPHHKSVRSTLVISTRWEDQPQAIRDRFNPDDLRFRKLLKQTKDGSLLFLTPPKENYFVTMERVGDVTRYASITIIATKELRIGRFTHLHVILLSAFAAIVVFTLILFWVMRSVSGPVGQLRDWAKALDGETVDGPRPDFRYHELNSLAEMIQSGLQSVHESAEREKRFLGFASHELRTPMAVSRTNVELLRKLIEGESDKAKQLAVLDRIERAGLTMADLTETLLWLNRQDEKSLPEQNMPLGALVQDICAELSHLLQGKAVSVDLKTDETQVMVPEILCRIVITNLIRNAFQHTSEGKVEICQSGAKVEIINQDQTALPFEDDLGFGLGLELTERLIQKYGWQYVSQDIACGREVTISFISRH